jgi:transposase-like protein
MPRSPPRKKEETTGMSITKPKRAARRTAAEWAEIIERYQDSGMTVPAFAAQEGVGAKRLRVWRSRLQRRSTGTRRITSHHHRPSSTPGRKQAGSGPAPFLPLRLHNIAADAVNAIELTLAAGTTVRLTGRFAELFLNQMLARL